jgi:hypothetical protein
VREAQIRGGLHAYETAVRLLREAAWPPSASNRAILDLFYGQTLVNYFHSYSWEIRQRERVESKDPLDLKKWTTDEVASEAARAYARVWAQRDNLGVDPIDRFGDNLHHGNYPERVRGTARDLLSYLIVDLLADTSLWSPGRQELYSLDVRTLLGTVRADIDDPAAHPLTKLAAVLTDLEAWHTAGGRREAAFEARLERLRRLHVAFTSEDDRKLIRDDLERRLPAVRDLEWWSVGRAVLASFVKATPEPMLSSARAIAQAGAAAHPETIGGRQCRAIVEAIEAPSYQLTAMSSTARAGPRSTLTMRTWRGSGSARTPSISRTVCALRATTRSCPTGGRSRSSSRRHGRRPNGRWNCLRRPTTASTARSSHRPSTAPACTWSWPPRDRSSVAKRRTSSRP